MINRSLIRKSLWSGVSHRPNIPVNSTTLINTENQNDFLYKIQFQKVKPECHQAYKDLYNEYLPKIIANQGQNARKEYVGSWMTWYGAQDEAIHLWRYKGNYGSHKFSKSDKSKSEDADYIKFREERGKMIDIRRNDLIFEFGFSPQIKAFQNWQEEQKKSGQNFDENLIYEVRSYELKPGTLTRWVAEWNQVFNSKMRGHDGEFVGGFFTDIGKLNTIYYIWAYKSLEDRKIVRDKCWLNPDWANVVVDTQKICRNMSSQIMLPMECSRLQ